MGPSPGAQRPNARRSACPTTLGLIAAAGLGCAELGEPRFEPVVGSIEFVESIPAAGATEVDPLVRIDLCLSEIADPRVFDDFTATLHSGNLTFDAQIELQLFGWRAPGERDAIADAPWCPGSIVSLTPRSPLQPGLTYRVRVEPVARGWAGELLDTTGAGWKIDDQGVAIWTLEFRVAGQAGDDPPATIPELAPGPTLTELFATGGPFDPARDLCSCHRGADPVASATLDLSSPTRAWDDLVLANTIGSTGFALVAIGEPSASALIHELLRDAEGEPLYRAQHAMPPDAALAFDDLVALTRWIAEGARLE